MSAAERSAAHGRAARLLSGSAASADRVAEHLLVAYPTEDPWVVEQLRVAARAATASGAAESAFAYLRRALVEPPPEEVRASLLLDLGLAEFNANQPQWEQHLAEALAGAADEVSQVDAALHLGRALAAHLRFVEAVEVCDGVGAGLDQRVRGVVDARELGDRLGDDRPGSSPPRWPGAPRHSSAARGSRTSRPRSWRSRPTGRR